jgi:hypothetical protein
MSLKWGIIYDLPFFKKHHREEAHMSFASDFFKSSRKLPLSTEDSLSILVENYSKIMKIYRVIKEQEVKTKEKKKKANTELRKLRNIENKFKNLTPREQKEIAAKKEHFEKMREEEDIIYFENKPLNDTDLYVIIIKKHKNIIQMLESGDRALRKKASAFIKKYVDKKIKKGKKKSTFMDFMSKISFSDMILNSLNVNLENHRPQKEKNDDAYTITIKF